MSRSGQREWGSAVKRSSSSWILEVAVPLVLIAIILTADILEGPKTAYVGVLAVVPMLSAVFGRPLATLGVGIVTWFSAFIFGNFASDGNVTAQTVRLIIIALVSMLAVGAAYLRQAREAQFLRAREQAEELEQIRQLAATDWLTGIKNRRGVIAALDNWPHHGERCLAIVDCDRLKIINDQYGHQVGDGYIYAVAGRLKGSISSNDIIGRWGGDEFIVIMALTLEQARPTLDRVHGTISERPIAIDNVLIPGSVSIGVAQWCEGEDLDIVLSRADAALYDAKHSGRDRIVVAAEV